jgi:hypothetical protein
MSCTIDPEHNPVADAMMSDFPRKKVGSTCVFPSDAKSLSWTWWTAPHELFNPRQERGGIQFDARSQGKGIFKGRVATVRPDTFQQSDTSLVRLVSRVEAAQGAIADQFSTDTRAASACCTLFSASTPRISRTGTSSLFASCTITSAIFRGSPSALNYVLNTSPEKFQVVWKVEGMTIESSDPPSSILVA